MAAQGFNRPVDFREELDESTPKESIGYGEG